MVRLLLVDGDWLVAVLRDHAGFATRRGEMSPEMENRSRPTDVHAPRPTSIEFERQLAMADLDIGIEAYAGALARLIDLRRSAAPRSREESLALERRIALCLYHTGRIDEARGTVRAALESTPAEVSPLERSRCLLISGTAAVDKGLFPEAKADALDALSALGEESLLQEAGIARSLLGAIAFRSGQSETAREQWERSLEIFRKLGDLPHLAGSYMNLGNVHKLRSDLDRAAEQYHVAYYLATTLGDNGVVTMAAQNLGIVLARVGKYREARTYLDRSLRIATEMGDSVRAFRARLMIAKVDRFEYRIPDARERLESCRASHGVALPQREHCLLLLEESLLDLNDGNVARARQTAADLRLRVEAMAPRGDLMAEVLLLDADIAAAEAQWEEADRAAALAAEIGRADKDRAIEERATLRRAVAWARSGKREESDVLIQGLLERLRSRGEWPALAEVLRTQALEALEAGGDPGAALTRLHEAAEIYRRIDVPRAVTLVEVEQIHCMIALGLRDEAISRIQELRRGDHGDLSVLASKLDGAAEALERRQAEDGGIELDGRQVHERLEEILGAPGSAWDRLTDILSLLRKALEVDGILFARDLGAELEVLSSQGIDAAQGKKMIPSSTLGPDGNGSEERRPDSTSPGSVLTIPLAVRGTPYALHMRRYGKMGRGPLGRSTRDYAMVLVAEIARALEMGSRDPEAGRLSKGISVADVVTQNARMLKILDLIRRVGDTDLTVLLQGETGTGKKLLANAIHRASERRARPMVTVDCAALPDSLLEAELFGYRKGAFTGAMQDRTGLLAEAAGGTVFLDEIDKAGLPVQRRFLHLLDSGEIRPVGATSYVKLDVRIVCATSSPDLRREVASGHFLKDLYYRLNDISIEVPPLRERSDDILLLASCFVETYAAQAGRRIRGISASFRRALLSHDWPGNVRELEKAIRRAVTLADDDVLLTPDLLPSDVLEGAGDVGLDEDGNDSLKKRVDQFERRAIEQALLSCHGNKSHAAALLGLSRKGLKGKMARFRLGRRSPSGG